MTLDKIDDIPISDFMVDAADVAADATPVDVDEFRSVMRQLAGCVTVITTESNGGLYGLTVTAICSVCATPPTILIAVDKSSRTHPHIDRKGAFAVNILADGQKHIAEHFASKGDDQLATIPHVVNAKGVPLIEGAAAQLHCEVQDRISIGTHTLFVAHIVGTGIQDSTPLIYHNAKYGLVTHI